MPVCKCSSCGGKDKPLEWFEINPKTGERFKTCYKSREYAKQPERRVYKREYSRTHTTKNKVEIDRRYREKNRERIAETHRRRYCAKREWILERQKLYAQANKEKKREYNRRYYRENREKLKEQNRQYHQNNKEAASEWYKQYYQENIEAIYANHRARRAKKRGNGGSHTVKELNELFEQQEGLCYYCGRLLFESFKVPFHVEHKIPISIGGSNDISNIALSCKECNLRKHTKTDEEFLELLVRIG